MKLTRIVTHNDMDGVVSAALCSYALKVHRVRFAGPGNIVKGEVSTSEEDVVCDLPCPLVYGLWFDHHEGNLEDLKLRGVSPEEIKGRFAPKDSCSRVVMEYFTQQGVDFPPYLEDTVAETDVIDSFRYRSIEHWRKETPGKLVDYSIKAPTATLREKHLYLRELVPLVRDHPLEEVIEAPKVRDRIEKYRQEEERMLKLIEQDATFLPFDERREVVVLDLTRHNRRPRVIKNLASLLYPDALAILEVYPIFQDGVKTTNLGFSMSLTVNMANKDHPKDLGEIMRALNIGDGHKGAAAGTVYARSKAEMLKKKEQTLRKIFELWKAQT